MRKTSKQTCQQIAIMRTAAAFLKVLAYKYFVEPEKQTQTVKRVFKAGRLDITSWMCHWHWHELIN